jgi:O-antigen/teichoic acid export membrane protein
MNIPPPIPVSAEQNQAAKPAASPFRSLHHQLSDNLFWYLLSSATGFASTVLGLGLLWRAIGFEAQVHYAQLQVVVALFILLADWGLERGIIRFANTEESFLRFALIRFGQGALLLLIPALTLAWWWYYRTSSMAIVAALTTGVSYAFFYLTSGLSRSSGRIRNFAAWNTLRNLLTMSVLVLLYLSGNLTLARWYSATAAVTTAIGALILIKFLRTHPLSHPTTAQHITFHRYTSILFIGGIILWLHSLIDIAFLQHFHRSQLPDFRLLHDYTLFFGMATMLVHRAWPTIFFSFSHTTTTQHSRSRQLELTHTVALLGGISMVAAAPLMLPMLKGSAFAPGWIVPLTLIVAVECLGLMIAIVRPHYELHQRTLTMVLIFSLATIVNAAANALLVPAYGISGAATASVVSMEVVLWSLIVGDKKLCHRATLGRLMLWQIGLAGGLGITAVFMQKILAG